MFCYEFLMYRINYYTNELNKLPKGKFVHNKQRNKKAVVLYATENGKRIHNEHYVDSKQGIINSSLLVKRQKIEQNRDKYSSALPHSAKLDISNISNLPYRITQLPSSLFEFSRKNVVPEYEKSEERYSCVYNGIKMTSRAEVTIAEVLSSLDLEFLYEPKVHIGAKYFVPDFLVNVPELDCCFFIEYLGMLSNDEYANKNFDKIRLYQANGISTDSALLVIWDNGKSMTDPTKVRLQIEEMINYLTIINLTPHA